MVKGKLLFSLLEESGLGNPDVLTYLERSRLERLFREISELADEPSAGEPGGATAA